MTTRPAQFVWATGVFLLSALTASSQARSARTVREVMFDMVVPASDAIFEVADPPAGNEAWTTIRQHGARLEEAGGLLSADTVRRRDAAWTAEADLYLSAAHAVSIAATNKNFDALTEASDALAQTCITCHAKFLPKK